MNKTIRTMLAVLVVISMIAPAMAGDGTGVVAEAYGSASAGDGYASASTQAHVTYTGTLTTGYADVYSGADGNEYACSYSGMGGMVNPGVMGSVYGYTYADAYSGVYDATAWTEAYTGGNDLSEYVTLSTELSMDAYSYGEYASADAYVETTADWTIAGIDSLGYVGAYANGNSYAETGYYQGNMAYAVSSTNAGAEANGGVIAVGEMGADAWSYADTYIDDDGNNHALYENGGYAWGSYVSAWLEATAYLNED